MILAFSPTSGAMLNAMGPEGKPAKPVHRRATRAKLPEPKSPKAFVASGSGQRSMPSCNGYQPSAMLPSAPSALNAAEQTPFKSPKVSAKVMAKKRFAEEKAELHEHLAHLEAQPNPDLLSPDTVAQLYAAKDTMSPRGKRAVERALKRNLTRTQMGVML